MFTLFGKIKATESNDMLIFELSESVQLVLDIIDPPYYSSFYIKHNGENVANFSVHPDKVEDIQRFFKTIPSQVDETNSSKVNSTNRKEVTYDLLIGTLNDLKLTKFVSKIESYIEPDNSLKIC